LNFGVAMERQIGTIRAVRDVEIEHWLTELRLLRSLFSSEELSKPVLQVFEETLPNLSVVNDERNNNMEVKWRDNEGCNKDGMDAHAYLFQRLSMASIPRFPGFDNSASAGTFQGKQHLNSENVQHVTLLVLNLRKLEKHSFWKCNLLLNKLFQQIYPRFFQRVLILYFNSYEFKHILCSSRFMPFGIQNEFYPTNYPMPIHTSKT